MNKYQVLQLGQNDEQGEQFENEEFRKKICFDADEKGGQSQIEAR